MPVPTLISELSTTATSNSPGGSVDTPSTLDNYQRAHASFIAQLRDSVADIEDGTTTVPLATSAGVCTGNSATATTAAACSGNSATATAANGLKTATTTVSVSAATAPSSGQVLTATGSVAATWQTPATTDLDTLIGFNDYFESTDQTVTFNSALSVAHGLGAKPRFFTVSLKCATTEGNYAAGDEILMTHTADVGTWVCTVSANATNITISEAGNMRLNDKSTYSLFGVTAGNWRWVVRAWA